MFGGFFGGLASGTFSGQYRCYPVSFIGKNDAETGNKIFLPSSALDRLGRHRCTKLDIGPSQCSTQTIGDCQLPSLFLISRYVLCSVVAHRVSHAL